MKKSAKLALILSIVIILDLAIIAMMMYQDAPLNEMKSNDNEMISNDFFSNPEFSIKEIKIYELEKPAALPKPQARNQGISECGYFG